MCGFHLKIIHLLSDVWLAYRTIGSVFRPSVPEQLLTSRQCNKSLGNAPLPNWSCKKNVFQNVKLGAWIIQVEVKAIVVALDSELFSCRYTQTELHAYNPHRELRV